MNKYPKIHTLWKRDPERKMVVMPGEYALPEIEMLANLPWEWTEKIDGTNIRIGWDGEDVAYGGRTDKAQIPKHLLEYLRIFNIFRGQC